MARVNPEYPPEKPKDYTIESQNLNLLTVQEVAKIFKVTPYTVRVWLKDGELIGTKMGRGSTGHWRITHEEVVRFANDKFGSDVQSA